jgi:hypothetical protein
MELDGEGWECRGRASREEKEQIEEEMKGDERLGGPSPNPN